MTMNEIPHTLLPYNYCFAGYCIGFVTDALFVSNQYCFLLVFLIKHSSYSTEAKVTLSLMFVERFSFVLQFLKLLLEF